MKSVVLCSGGLDSVVLAHLVHRTGDEVELLHVTYGQRHRKERESARATAKRLKVPLYEVDVKGYAKALGATNALTGGLRVPHVHYKSDENKTTTVPARNLMFGAVGASVAAAHGAERVEMAIQGSEGTIYPDCSFSFIDAMRATIGLATNGQVEFLSRFAHLRKSAIVGVGAQLGVPMWDTWSCYEGLHWQCGTCGACLKRREGFVEAGVQDTTFYASNIAMDNVWVIRP